MIKKIFTIAFLILTFYGCAVDDCFKNSGRMISRPVAVSGFKKVIVHKGISLVVSQADEYSVNIISGENLIDGIEAKVTDSTLVLKDVTECNWTRDYGVTTIHVSAPNLTDIISKTEQKITSGNTLNFPYLRLEALDGNHAGTGDFHLTVDNQLVFIETNNVAGFYLGGNTEMLTAAFYEGNGPLRASNLIASNVFIFHRGTNDMYVHPISAISGDIYSTGDVYCPEPPTVDVQQRYTGRLIFTD